jgi:alpha-L-arabinofuranosidase
MCNRPGYRWKFFRGPRESRQPYSGDWYSKEEPGLTQSRGFGPLETVDLCQSLGCDPILTLNALVRRCRLNR